MKKNLFTLIEHAAFFVNLISFLYVTKSTDCFCYLPIPGPPVQTERLQAQEVIFCQENKEKISFSIL